MNAQANGATWSRGPDRHRVPLPHPRAADAARATNHVVLLHASASSARQWATAAAVLEAHPARLQVHSVEFHGHGAQPAWPGPVPLTLAHEAAPVAALLQRLGGAHLVGHSYGGAVALKLAHCRPGLVHSVVAFEPVLMRLLGGDAAPAAEARAVHAVVATMRRASAAGQPQAAAQSFIDFWSGPGSWDMLAPERRHSIAQRVPVLLQHFDALFGDPMDARRLARLRVPLLLLSGARTVDTARALVRRVHGALPHARHEVMPEMGHMGPLTHPAAFNQRVAAFLGEQAAARRAAWAADAGAATSHARRAGWFRTLLS